MKKVELYKEFRHFAQQYSQSVIEFIAASRVKPVDLEKDLKLITFDGKTYYNQLDLECLHIDLCFEAYLDRMIG